MSNEKPKRKRRTKAQIEADKAKEVKVQRAPKQEGLGDKVEKVLKATGVKAFVEFMNGGEPCSGCEKRKAALNKITATRKAKALTYDDLVFIGSIKDKKTLKATEVVTLHKIHARVYNYTYTIPGNCASCVIQRRNDLVNLYNIYNEK